MKVELNRAYIGIRVNGEPCRIAAEKAFLHTNEDGSLFQFEAQFLKGTPIDTILRIGNRTRMRVSFNGLAEQPSFIYSEPGQTILIDGVEFMSE